MMASRYERTVTLLAPLANLTDEGWTNVSGGGGAGNSNDDSSTVPALATAGPDGGPCVRLTMGSGATYRRIAITPPNSGGYPCKGTIAFWVKTDHHDDVKIAIIAQRAADSGYYQGFYSISAAKSVANSHDGEWFLFKIDASQLSAAGGAPAWGSVQYIDQFQIGIHPVVSPAGATYTCHFADFYCALETRPKLILTFDDSNNTDLTVAAPYLTSLGLKATTYTYVDVIGTSNFLTEANINTLKNTHRWSIASHGGTALTTLDQAARLADLNAVKTWMQARGYSWRHYAYPLGFFDKDVCADMATVGFLTARGTDNSPYSPAVEPDLLRLPGWGTAEKTLAQFMISLNNAVQYGLTWHIYTHGLFDYSGGTNATHTDIGTWESMMDQVAAYADQDLIEVVTIDEWYNGLTPATTTGRSLIHPLISSIVS
jgi:hypothetical protein